MAVGVSEGDLSIVGLTIQVVGVGCIALLFQLLYRALPRPYFQLWSRAWLMMALAVLSLRASIAYREWLWPLEVVYYLGEYRFAWLLASGFARYPERPARATPSRRWPWFLALIWAVVLTQVSERFAMRFATHALLFALLLGYAAVQLGRIRMPRAHSWAKAFALVSLGLLTLDFFGNGVAQFVVTFSGRDFAAGYSAYQSIVDLFLEVLVAFGLVAIAAVDMRSTLERARAAMQGERDRMSMLAHQDALTGCFNRLALEELKGRVEQRRGSIAMIDMNDLKPLNDRHGHALGDLALCQVASALKAMLREHDHVFRTGGDEFVLVSFDLPAATALTRLQAVQRNLQAGSLQPDHVGGISIAFGAADFDGTAGFELAMATADSAMYAHKRSCHAERGSVPR